MILFYWVVRSSLMASILVVFILILKLMLRDRLGAKWHYYIWFLVLLRLVMPVHFQSPVSIYNTLPSPMPITIIDSQPDPIEGIITLPRERTSESEFNFGGGNPVTDFPRVEIPTSKTFYPEWPQMLYYTWLAGVFAFLLYMLIINGKFWLDLKRDNELTDLEVLGLFAECRKRMGISKEVILIQTDQVKATTLFGFVRPKLLLPRGIEKMVPLRDLTYIFYHELAHIKQKDIFINLIAGFLQVVHWFNPIIWYGFYRMRQDREVACDALALSYVHPGKYKEYGRVIIDLLENFSRPSRVSGMVGIVSDGSNAKQRISRISIFKKNSHRLPATAALMLVFLGVLFLTNANEAVEIGANEVVEMERRGTTVGNIYNGGLFAREGDWIYYSDITDEWKLYKVKIDGSSKTLISEDQVRNINVLDGWVYYTTGLEVIFVENETPIINGPYIFKIREDGSDKTQLTEHRSDFFVQVIDEWIYYSNINRLYRIDLDGQNQTLIANVFGEANIVDGWVYHSWGRRIYKSKLDGSESSEITSNLLDDIDIAGDWIYSFGSKFIVAGDWIYYIGPETNIYRVRTDGQQETRLNSDASANINVVDNWVYYINQSDGNVYRVRTDGTRRSRVINERVSSIYILDDLIYYRPANNGQAIPSVSEGRRAENRENREEILRKLRERAVKVLGEAVREQYDYLTPQDVYEQGVEDVIYNPDVPYGMIIYLMIPEANEFNQAINETGTAVIRLLDEISKVTDLENLLDHLDVMVLLPTYIEFMEVSVGVESLVETDWSSISVSELLGLASYTYTSESAFDDYVGKITAP